MVVKVGSGAAVVSVGSGVDVNEGALGEIGVLSCASKEVLVTDGTDKAVEVEIDVGAAKDGSGVLVRGCNRYDPVIAIEVRVLSAFRTAASLAGPPEIIQPRINKVTNRPVSPSACK